MAVRLPQHVAATLGIDPVAEPATIHHLLRTSTGHVGPLLTTTAKSFFCTLVHSLPIDGNVEVANATVPVQKWHYRQIQLGGNPCAEVVEVPFATDSDIEPPTSVENLLVKAWLNSADLLDTSGSLRRNVVVFDWLPSVTEPVKSVVRAIAGVSCLTHSSKAWADPQLIEIQTTSRLIAHHDQVMLRRLFTETTTEQSPKWRFLSLYRILEHAYLEWVFRELSDRFFSEPQAALDSASTALRSEIEQFIRLVEANRLENGFSDLMIKFGHLAAAGNRFCVLLQREIERSKNYKDQFKRGVAVCYQIRCSIVHAGIHSVVFDKAPDAETALNELMPIMEEIVAKFLGIDTA